MDEKMEQKQVRRFITGWAATRGEVTVTEIQSAVLDHFALDANFVRRFRPIAIGCDQETTRALLREPLAMLVAEELQRLHAEGRSRFMLDGERWIRRPEWRSPDESSCA